MGVTYIKVKKDIAPKYDNHFKSSPYSLCPDKN